MIKNIAFSLCLAIISSFSFAEIENCIDPAFFKESPLTLAYNHGRLYVNGHYVSAEALQESIDKKMYRCIELEKIDTILQYAFSKEYCPVLKDCELDYLDLLLSLHQKNTELNAEGFGWVMYRLIMTDLENKLQYLDIKNQFIIDAITGEVEIGYAYPDEIWPHIILLEEILSNMAYAQSLKPSEREGVSQLIYKLKESASSNVVINSKDGYVNLRKGPSTKSEIMAKLKNETTFKIEEIVKDWFLIVPEQNNIKGYIHTSGIKNL